LVVEKKLAKIVVVSQAGFTLVELLVAITILLIATTGFVPMFVYNAQAAQASTARLVGTKLASARMEQIRAIPYNQLGVVGKNPSGVIKQTTDTVPMDGKIYSITVYVSWYTDPTYTGSNYNNYKKAQVIVKVRGVFTGQPITCASMESYVSPEGEEQASSGGNLRVIAERSWKNAASGYDKVAGIHVTVQSGPDQYTTDEGTALFAGISLSNGTSFTMLVDPGSSNWMVRPGEESQSVILFDSTWQTVTVKVEHPAHLSINLKDITDTDPANPKNMLFSGTLTLNPPASLTNLAQKTSNLTAQSSVSIGNIWPVGDNGDSGTYDIELNGISATDKDGHTINYNDYLLSADPSKDVLWPGGCGKFQPGEDKTITISLTPKP